MSERKNRYRIGCFALALFILALLGAHAIHLDEDPPPWGVSVYQPVDEGAYALMAINEKVYGTPKPTSQDTGGYSSWISENFIMNTVGNALNIIGFKLLGNNYYGLRLPYTLVFFVNVLLFYLVLVRLGKRYGANDPRTPLITLLAVLWMAMDFTFLVASRVVETSMIRLLFVLLIALVHVSMPDSERLRYFLIGALTTFSVFMVYITNVFLFLAGMIMLIHRLKTKGMRSFIKALAWYVAGCDLIFIVVERYYMDYWGVEAVQNAFNALFSFSSDSMAGIVGTESTMLPMALVMPVLRLISSNSFIYNLPLVCGFHLLLPNLLGMIKKEQDEGLLFILAMVSSFFLQHLVAYDTVTRKMIVVFPLVAVLVYAVLLRLLARPDVVRDGALAQEKEPGLNVSRLMILAWRALAVPLLIGAFIFRFFVFDQTSKDYETTDVIVLLVTEVVPVLGLIVLECLERIGKRRGWLQAYGIREDGLKCSRSWAWKRWRRIAAVFALMCLCNVMFQMRYVWLFPKYGERDAMIDIADVVDGQYVLGGGFQLGYTLYNNMKPIVSNPESTMEQVKRFPDTLIMEYNNENNRLEPYFRRTYYSYLDRRFIPAKVLHRDFQTFGVKRDMWLYYAVKPQDYAALAVQ